MGYSSWGHKESDTTEHTHPRNWRPPEGMATSQLKPSDTDFGLLITKLEDNIYMYGFKLLNSWLLQKWEANIYEMLII